MLVSLTMQLDPLGKKIAATYVKIEKFGIIRGMIDKMLLNRAVLGMMYAIGDYIGFL